MVMVPQVTAVSRRCLLRFDVQLPLLPLLVSVRRRPPAPELYITRTGMTRLVAIYLFAT